MGEEEGKAANAASLRFQLLPFVLSSLGGAGFVLFGVHTPPLHGTQGLLPDWHSGTLQCWVMNLGLQDAKHKLQPIGSLVEY